MLPLPPVANTMNFGPEFTLWMVLLVLLNYLVIICLPLLLPILAGWEGIRLLKRGATLHSMWATALGMDVLSIGLVFMVSLGILYAPFIWNGVTIVTNAGPVFLFVVVIGLAILKAVVFKARSIPAARRVVFISTGIDALAVTLVILLIMAWRR